MNKIKQMYKKLLKEHGPQGWWPIINPKTLICEYHPGDYSYPRTNSERFEICVGAILTQGTQWYPNVVRSLQQLKLGRQLTKKELEVLREAEIWHKKIFGNRKIITKNDILTQNTSWKNVEAALKNLKAARMLSAKKILSAHSSMLAKIIRPSGFHNQKAKKIRIFAKYYLSLDSRVPARDDLLALWGVGPETADSILLYAYHVPTFVVDAYTKRVFSMHDKTYDEIKSYFEKNLPKDWKLFGEYHALIVRHAKYLAQSISKIKS